jgi:hypothetical protein
VDQQRPGRRRGQQPQQNRTQQAEDPRIAGVRVHGEMPDAEQRNHRGKVGIAERLGKTQPNKLRRVRTTERNRRRLRIERRAQPARRELAGRGPQLPRQPMLLQRIGSRRRLRREGGSGSVGGGLGLPVQGSGLIDPHRRIRHRLTSP